MAIFNDIFDAVAAIALWYKQRAGDGFVLSDIPRLIPLRWGYFRDNWEFIKKKLEGRGVDSLNSDRFESKLQEMSDFIISNRESKINPFNRSDILFRFYEIFDIIEVSSIPISKEEQDIINKKINSISQYTRQDFEDARSYIQQEHDVIVDKRGLTDEDYNRVVGRSPVPATSNPSINDILQLQQLRNTIKAIDLMLASEFQINPNPINPFQLARDNANNPEFNIQQYASGFLVSFEYDDTLQKLALRYLGDPDKWIDISIANGLRPPYIDEIGERIYPISNGEGHKISIGEIDLNNLPNRNKFYAGQTILLQSDSYRQPDSRKILNIVVIPVSGELVLELDGDPDLNKYKISQNTHIRVFKPNTVNSNFYILIPSAEELPNTIRKSVPFFLQDAGDDEKRQGVDLALNPSADLIITSSDDFKLSYGIANSIQAIKLKIITEKGTLNRHPEYGLINVVGRKNLDLNGIREDLVKSITEQIQGDDRFDRVERISIRSLANAANKDSASGVSIQLAVRLAGSGRVVPISFTVTPN